MSRCIGWLVLCTMFSALASGCTHLTCGPGTHVENAVCTPDDASVRDASVRDAFVGDDASVDGGGLDVGTDAPLVSDAGTDDAGTSDAGSRDDAGPGLTCATQCDCPSGTTCTIDGTCMGETCSQACSATVPCPCGRACDRGYCVDPGPPRPSCTRDCECPHGNRCADGQCVYDCPFGRSLDCESDTDCSACGTRCEPFTATCTPVGHGCYCDTSCMSWGLDGQRCDAATRDCAAPTGTLIDFGAGDFTTMFSIGRYMSAASASGSGNVTHLTFVADLDSPSSDLVSVSVTSPDGASAMAMMSAPCSLGEQARWTGELDLATPATLAGRWQLLLQDQGLGSTGPGTQVAHAWLYAH